MLGCTVAWRIAPVGLQGVRAAIPTRAEQPCPRSRTLCGDHGGSAALEEGHGAAGGNGPGAAADVRGLPVGPVPHDNPAGVTGQPAGRFRGNVHALFEHGLPGAAGFSSTGAAPSTAMIAFLAWPGSRCSTDTKHEPGAPGVPLRAEPRPRPTGARRRRALIGSSAADAAVPARRHEVPSGRSAGGLMRRSAAYNRMPLSRAGSLCAQGGRGGACALCHGAPGATGVRVLADCVTVRGPTDGDRCGRASMLTAHPARWHRAGRRRDGAPS
jgi:hypothetical protein